MKKFTILFLVTFLGFLTIEKGMSQAVFPQKTISSNKDHNHKGRIFAGGAVSFWSDNKEETLSFDFAPEIGYLFNDDWGAGLLLGYGYASKKINNENVVGQVFKVSPFVRYYYFHKNPFNLYLDAGVGLNALKDNYSNSKTGFEIGLRPGACVDLTEGLCLCMRMGFIGYRNNYYVGEEPQMGNNGFGFRFAPEELMIGLEMEF